MENFGNCDHSQLKINSLARKFRELNKNILLALLDPI